MADSYRETDFWGNNMGETMLPELDVSAYEWHTARYEFATGFIKEGDSVLDVGCGIGYGSKILLKKASKYVGFDKYTMRKLRALQSYPDDRSTFLVHSANDKFPFDDASFNCVVCFEAIEHIDNDNFAIKEIYRVLKNDGVFVCSTPLKIEGHQGGYHIREYSAINFRELIESSFTNTRYFGQGWNRSIVENLLSKYILCVAVK